MSLAVTITWLTEKGFHIEFNDVTFPDTTLLVEIRKGYQRADMLIPHSELNEARDTDEALSRKLAELYREWEVHFE